MSMESHTCVDCGGELARTGPAAWTCANPLCPGGTVHHLCGFCRMPSFSLDLRRCTNRSCRTHGIERELCGSCHHLAVIDLQGQQFCINRSCPSNKGHVDTCPTCSNDSLLRWGAIEVCVKSTCTDLLVPRTPTVIDGTFMAVPAPTLIAPPEPVPEPTPVPAHKKTSPPSDPWGLRAASAPTVITPPGEPPAASNPTPPAPPMPVAQIVAPPPPQVVAAPPAPPAPPAVQYSAPALQAPAPAPSAPVDPPTSLVPVVTTPSAPDSFADEVPAATEIERAFQFLRRAYLATEDGAIAPVVLVIGLAGAGKSTFLTMFGEMLASGAGKYHFPYPGVTARSIDLDGAIERVLGSNGAAERPALRRRVRDLVYDFAASNLQEHLSAGRWVPATVRESGSGGSAHSCFLVTELTRGGAPIGRIVTIETSGEDFQEVLSLLGESRADSDASTPLHRIILKLMDLATGLVVLLDPSAPDSDQRYAPFFRRLKEELEGRAAHALDKTLSDLLDQQKLAPAKGTGLTGAIQTAQEEAAHADRLLNTRKKLLADLQETGEDLASIPDTNEAMAMLANRRKVLLDELEVLARAVVEGFAQKADEAFEKLGHTPSNYRRYYEALITTLHPHRNPKAFEDAATMRLKLAEKRASQADQVLLDILRKAGARIELTTAFLDRWRSRPNGRRFARLTSVGLVVTKSDRHPVVHPPSEYPRFKMPASQPHLDAVGTYLSLIGGQLRSYNATAIGYAVPGERGHAPGPSNSFTPVNILEPLLDVFLPRGDE